MADMWWLRCLLELPNHHHGSHRGVITFLFYYIQIFLSFLFFRNTPQNFTKRIFFCEPHILLKYGVHLINYQFLPFLKFKTLLKTLPNQGLI
jgi:hypothetical protein